MSWFPQRWRRTPTLAQLYTLNFIILEKVSALSKEIDDLSAAVASTAVAGAVTDIQTLTAAIAAANSNGDAAAIEDAVSKLGALADTLNSAVSPAPTVPTSAS